MKGKFILFGLFMLFTTSGVLAQNKTLPKSIISSSASIRTYYDQKQLKAMQKGELLELYIERIKVLVKTLPYIALATKPGVTMADLGIPSDAEHIKALELETEATNTFLEVTVDFQRKMMPYSDKQNMINSILFYEQTLKSLHEFDQMSE